MAHMIPLREDTFTRRDQPKESVWNIIGTILLLLMLAGITGASWIIIVYTLIKIF